MCSVATNGTNEVKLLSHLLTYDTSTGMTSHRSTRPGLRHENGSFLSEASKRSLELLLLMTPFASSGSLPLPLSVCHVCLCDCAKEI